MDEPNYYGVGAKFPFQVNKTTGRIVTNTGPENVKESIYLILMTNKGERLLKKNYGARLMSYTFENSSAGMTTFFASQIKADIESNEPRVSDVVVTMDNKTKPGCLFIGIDYTLNATGDREDMVFPFFLDTTEDEES